MPSQSTTTIASAFASMTSRNRDSLSRSSPFSRSIPSECPISPTWSCDMTAPEAILIPDETSRFTRTSVHSTVQRIVRRRSLSPPVHLSPGRRRYFVIDRRRSRIAVQVRPHALEIVRRNVHGRPGENARRIPEWSAEVHPVLVDVELADPLVVCRAAHLEHRDPALHLAEHFHVPEEDDRVGERRDVTLRDRSTPHQRRSGRREQPRDLLM